VVSKGRHQNNKINAALKKLPSSIEVDQNKNGHNWGCLVCTKCGERFAINGTPRNPGSHAKQLLAFARKHAHDRNKVQL